MDRFLSKLDLRDIKIKPEGNQYLPDDDEPAPESNNHHDAQFEDSGEDSVDSIVDDNDESSDEDASQAEIPVENDQNQTATATLETETVDSDVEDAPLFDDEVADEKDETEILKVSAKSRPSAVAGAIAGVVRESGRAEVQAIGAGATNQAVKAVAIARDYLWESELDAVCLPEFIDVIIDNEERTAIRLVVEVRDPVAE